jgi:hypothetical protein
MPKRSIGLITLAVGFVDVCKSEWVEKRDSRMPGELRFVNEGIAHDDKYYYFSNQHFLYQTTIDVTITNTNHNAIPPELQALSYNHIGDIDVMDGLIYGGLEDRNDGNGVLATWNTSTLEMTNYRITEQKDMPWVAIDPSTTNIWSLPWVRFCLECSLLYLFIFQISERRIYFQHLELENLRKGITIACIGFFLPCLCHLPSGNRHCTHSYPLCVFLYSDQLDTYTMPEGVELPKEIQGGAFYEGALYLATNIECAVWKVGRPSSYYLLSLTSPHFTSRTRCCLLLCTGHHKSTYSLVRVAGGPLDWSSDSRAVRLLQSP